VKRALAPIVRTQRGYNIIRSIDPALTLRGAPQTVRDVTAHAALIQHRFSAMGRSLRSTFTNRLRSISDNPVKLFGFDKNGVSKSLGGTLEDIMLFPEKFALSGKQIRYANEIVAMTKDLAAVLKREGLFPKNATIKDYIHRVVIGRYDDAGKLIGVRGRPGMGGKALGSVRSYEKHRKYATQEEGVRAGRAYDPNPENSIGTLTEEVFSKIGDEAFNKLTKSYGELPLDIFKKRFPQLAEKVEFARVNDELYMNMISPVFRKVCQSKEVAKICKTIGCPISASVAESLVKTTNRIIRMKCHYDAKSGNTTTIYTLGPRVEKS